MTFLPYAAAHGKAIKLDYIVATVNNDIITSTDLANRMRVIKRQLRRNTGAVPSDSTLRKQVLNYIIDERLQLQVATKMNIKVDDATINKALTNIANKNQLTVAQFKQRLSYDGYDYQQFRDDLLTEITIHRVQQDLNDKISVSPQEIDKSLSQSANAFTRYHLAHILLTLGEDPTSEQIQEVSHKAEHIISLLDSGAAFKDLAIKYSQSKQNLQGGDLGWRNIAELPTIFAGQVQKMALNEVRGPIRDGNNIHIIKLIAKKSDAKQHLVTQTHARHILLRTSERTDNNAIQTKLTAIRNSLITKEKDFSELAKIYSDDTNSASHGGDLGWISPDTLDPTFEQMMSSLAIDEISPSFETPFGWHIVQVLERRTLDDSLEFARNKIKEQIFMRKRAELLQNWLIQLRDSAHIEIRVADLK